MIQNNMLNKSTTQSYNDNIKYNNLINLCDNLILTLEDTKKNISNKLSFFRSNFKKSGDQKKKDITNSIQNLNIIKLFLQQQKTLNCKENCKEYQKFKTGILSELNKIRSILKEQRSNKLFHTKETKSFSYFSNKFNAESLFIDSETQTLNEVVETIQHYDEPNNNIKKILVESISNKIKSLNLNNIDLENIDKDIKITVKNYYEKNKNIYPEKLLDNIFSEIFLKKENNNQTFTVFTNNELNEQLNSLLNNENKCRDSKNILLLNYLSNLKNSLNGENDIFINLINLERLYENFLIMNENKNNVFINNLRILFTKFIIEINCSNLLLEENIEYNYNISIMEALRNFKVNAYDKIKVTISPKNNHEKLQFDKVFNTKINNEVKESVKETMKIELPNNIEYEYQLYDYIVANIDAMNNQELKIKLDQIKSVFNSQLEKINKLNIFNKVTKIENINEIIASSDEIIKYINNYKIQNKENLNLDILHKKNNDLNKYFMNTINLQHRRMIINQLFDITYPKKFNLIYDILSNISLNNIEGKYFQQNNYESGWYGKSVHLTSKSDINGALGDIFIKQNNKNSNTEVSINSLIEYCEQLINLLNNIKNKISKRSKKKEAIITKHINELGIIFSNINNTKPYVIYNNKNISYVKKSISAIIDQVKNELNKERFIINLQQKTKSFNYFEKENKKLFMDFLNKTDESASLEFITSNLLFLINRHQRINEEGLEKLVTQIYNKITSLKLDNIKIGQDEIKLTILNIVDQNNNAENLIIELMHKVFLSNLNNIKNDQPVGVFNIDKLNMILDNTLDLINNQEKCNDINNLFILSYLFDLKNELNQNHINDISIDLSKLKLIYRKFLQINQTKNNIFINNLRVFFTDFIIELNIHNLLLEKNIEHTYYLSLIKITEGMNNNIELEKIEEVIPEKESENLNLLQDNSFISIKNNDWSVIENNNFNNSFSLKSEIINDNELKSFFLNNIDDIYDLNNIDEDLKINILDDINNIYKDLIGINKLNEIKSIISNNSNKNNKINEFNYNDSNLNKLYDKNNINKFKNILNIEHFELIIKDNLLDINSNNLRNDVIDSIKEHKDLVNSNQINSYTFNNMEFILNYLEKDFTNPSTKAIKSKEQVNLVLSMLPTVNFNVK
jgi:hypothetical protein